MGKPVGREVIYFYWYYIILTGRTFFNVAIFGFQYGFYNMINIMEYKRSKGVTGIKGVPVPVHFNT